MLGQIGDPQSAPVLRAILSDVNEHEMVRHEAAEALGAIGDQEAMPMLDALAAGEPGPLQGGTKMWFFKFMVSA